MKNQKGVNRSAVVLLEVLVEEESAAEAIRPLLRRILEGCQVKIGIRQFRGKPDLLKKLPERLQGYAAARRRGEDVRVIVLLDRDNDECVALKARLDEIALKSGMRPRSGVDSGEAFHVLNRIAVRELESWYFGDWAAVRKGFPKVPPDPPRSYRGDPDRASGKCSDAFENVLFSSGIRIASKPEWGRRIGPHLSLESNRSPSFLAFVSGVRAIVSA
ncbi:DUF4276 family protein [Streptomyces sp. NPDC090025]|uniref:DUF4276 family protein n=1 Tax=Streptomyces sp. NPDC090025 TaxID=3365922 RepID=UPI003834B141